LDRIDCVVIGAGVIGLAVAREIARLGHETILLEREQSFGTISSARNSEVIHAGIYYPKDSLKAKFCVEGSRLLYDYASAHHVPFKRCGKLIVATNPLQVKDLEQILSKALANEVPGMRSLSKTEAIALEPNLRCEAALLSENTGVVDSHAYMLSLLGEFEDAGGMVAYQSPIESIVPIQEGRGGYRLTVAGQANMQIEAKYVINCAGLSAVKVAEAIEGINLSTLPKAYFAKGNYFSLSGKSPFSRLIYPVPEPGGLGVHLTLDMGGQAKFGPDVEWLDMESEDQINYTVDPKRGERFYDAVRQYWPALPDGALNADYSGVRAKIASPTDPAADFWIHDQTEHGFVGLINLFGFESPGLTSSLAIAGRVKALLGA
jgi:L-2-hydroxyglutarate oxidase LhgO